jgi:hypothetical protein
MIVAAVRFKRCMMQLLHKIGAGIVVAGFLLVMAGGMTVHRGPDGTWVQVNLVHAAGAGLLFCRMLLAVIAAFASSRARAESEKGRAVDSSEPTR